MAQNITLMGASYSDVPSVLLPKTGGGTAQFDDTTITSSAATADDILAGKCAFVNGSLVIGTGTGGGGGGGSVTQDANGYIVLPSTAGGGGGGGGGGATQHTIHLEFSDSTDTDIDVYYDDPLIGTMITEYGPRPWAYDNKTVTIAELDGTEWYNTVSIPIGVQLIDYTALTANTALDDDGVAQPQQWYYTSDYTPIEAGMNFSYKAAMWFYICFYDESKNCLGSFNPYNNGVSPDPNDSNVAAGNILGTNIPSTAKYIRMSSSSDNSSGLSLIRTA